MQWVHGPEATTTPPLVLAHLPWPIHTDEAMSASSRMAQEVDEATSESSWTALANGQERDWWSIGLEGEVKKLEVSGPWSGTKGDSVEPKGATGHRSDRTKVAREEKEKLKEDEVKMDVDAPQGESAETKSSKKECDSSRVKRNPRLRLWDAGNQPGRSRGISLCAECPQRATRINLFLCDNRCSDKAVRYWQFASVVVEEGGEAHTVNLSQQCWNEQKVQQGKPRLNSWQWRAVVEKKAHRRAQDHVEGIWEQGMSNMGEFQSQKRHDTEDDSGSCGAEKRQEGIQGQWQLRESSCQRGSGRKSEEIGRYGM